MYVADGSVESFMPCVRQTVTYIVCSVLLNDRDEILMVQEAKLSCRGKWYLPAGRMERNERVEVCFLGFVATTNVCQNSLALRFARNTLCSALALSVG